MSMDDSEVIGHVIGAGAFAVGFAAGYADKIAYKIWKFVMPTTEPPTTASPTTAAANDSGAGASDQADEHQDSNVDAHAIGPRAQVGETRDAVSSPSTTEAGSNGGVLAIAADEPDALHLTEDNNMESEQTDAVSELEDQPGGSVNRESASSCQMQSTAPESSCEFAVEDKAEVPLEASQLSSSDVTPSVTVQVSGIETAPLSNSLELALLEEGEIPNQADEQQAVAVGEGALGSATAVSHDSQLDSQVDKADEALADPTNPDAETAGVVEVREQRRAAAYLREGEISQPLLKATQGFLELTQASRPADERAMDKLRDVLAAFMPTPAAIGNSAVDSDVLGRLEEANKENSLCSVHTNSTNLTAKRAAANSSAARVASPARKRSRRDVEKTPRQDFCRRRE